MDEDLAVDEDQPRASVVSFVIGAQTRVACSWHDITEIAERSELIGLPGVPEHVRGLAQIRGRPVPVVDLARFFDVQTLPSSPEDDHPRLLVAAAQGLEAAFWGRSIVVEQAPYIQAEQPQLDYGPRLHHHVRGEVDTRHGVAVLLDLPSVLDAARVR